MASLNKKESNINWAEGKFSVRAFFTCKQEFLFNKKFYWIFTNEKGVRQLITGNDDSRTKKFFKFERYSL